MLRSARIRTAHSATWLRIVVQVRRIQRCRTSTIVSCRNFTARSPMSVTGSFRNRCFTPETTRPKNSPTLRAMASLRKTSVSSTTATTSTATPTAANDTSRALVSPVKTRSAKAITGSASFVKMFQMPVTPMYKVVSAGVNPHEPNMAKVTPKAIAPPAGKVLATEVGVCVRTAACQNPSPGSAARFASQYVTRLRNVTATRDPISSIVRSPNALATSL